jgi:hypothetical protein
VDAQRLRVLQSAQSCFDRPLGLHRLGEFVNSPSSPVGACPAVRRFTHEVGHEGTD